MTTHLEHELELLIDKHSIQGVLEAIVEVCYAKSQHLEENWQDAEGAKAWDHMASAVTKALVNTAKHREHTS